MTAPWATAGALVASGKRLEYVCHGPHPADAPTLVLLHEGLGCVALWRGFPEALATATRWGVLAYSRAGYGGSAPADLPRPLDYMTREATTVLPEVLAAIGVRSGVLVGHSDGATIAAIHAGRLADDRLRGIVCMAPHFFTEQSGLAQIAQARRAFETGDLRARLAKYHRDPDNAFRGWCDSWLDPGFRAWNVADVLDDIRVPVLAIQGREDEYGTLAQIREIEARSPAPVETMILDRCRHSPFLDRADAVVAGIADFCRRLPAGDIAATGRG